MLSLFCSADWPSKSICKSVLNFRWTSLWRGGVGTAVYRQLCNDEGHLTKALSTLFGRLTTMSRQNSSLWKRYVLSSSYINYLTAFLWQYLLLQVRTSSWILFLKTYDGSLIKLPKSFTLQHVREGNLHRRLGRTLESSTKVFARSAEVSTTFRDELHVFTF
jgi:hypothetical protein